MIKVASPVAKIPITKGKRVVTAKYAKRRVCGGMQRPNCRLRLIFFEMTELL